MADGGSTAFGIQDTHGILWRPEHEIRLTSEGLGWTSIYASTQREAPYVAEFCAVKDHLIVLHLDGPVGVTRFLEGSQSHRLITPGGLFILPGGMDFGVQLESPLSTLHIYLRGDILNEVAGELGLGDARPPRLLARFGVHDFLIEQLGLNILTLLSEGSRCSALYAEYTARLLAAQLLRKHSTASVTEPEQANPRVATAVQRVIDHMQAHLSDGINLERLARVAGYSTSRLSSCFKAVTGLTPHQYLLSLRVEQAKKLLQKSDPIVEVALACGFTHQEHLTNVFRKFTSMTPATYRRAFRHTADGNASAVAR